MNEPGHNQRLLADVLGEGVPAGLRDSMLEATLRLARRRRHVRQARRATAVLGILAAIGLLARHPSPLPQSPSALPTSPYALVRTQPLPAALCVETKPFPVASIVPSLPSERIIRTAQAGRPVRRLSDDELLELAPQPAALVRFGPGAAELVLVNREAGQ